MIIQFIIIQDLLVHCQGDTYSLYLTGIPVQNMEVFGIVGISPCELHLRAKVHDVTLLALLVEVARHNQLVLMQGRGVHAMGRFHTGMHLKARNLKVTKDQVSLTSLKEAHALAIVIRCDPRDEA